jgi:hypothetical protein
VVVERERGRVERGGKRGRVRDRARGVVSPT